MTVQELLIELIKMPKDAIVQAYTINGEHSYDIIVHYDGTEDECCIGVGDPK